MLVPRLFGLLVILLSSLFIHAQSSHHFLKTIPVIDEHTPPWAIEMYQVNPDVQKVDHMHRQYFETNPFVKTTHTQNYKHWRRAVDAFVMEDGSLAFPSLEENIQQRKQYLEKRKEQQKVGNSWTPIGPFDTYSTGSDQVQVSWQANVYTIDQSLSNPDIVYVGTEAGGVFKSEDKGENWRFASFNSTMRTVRAIKVDPTNADHVFAGDGQSIYRTLDGGENWEVVYEASGLNVNDFSFNPSNTSRIIAATNHGLLSSDDNGQSWTTILSERIWDVERKPSSPETIYALRSNPADQRSEVWKSNDEGENFSLKDTGWYSSDDPDRSEGGGRMTVTPADEDRIYVILIGNSKAGDNGYIGVYRSEDSGESWTITNPPVGGPYNADHNNLATLSNTNTLQQGYYNLGIAASHENADDILVGCLNLWRSTNAGASFEAVGGYIGTVGWIHPDQQEIEINGGDMWVVNDGGINYSTDLFASHESRKNGLMASDYWGFGSGWNEDLVVGGRYHNGNSAYRPSFGEGRFLRLGGAEAATGYVQPGGESVAFFSDIAAQIIPQNLSEAVINTAGLSLFPGESFYSAHYSELEFDPNCYGHMLLGRDNNIWRSEDNGNTFDLVNSFGETGAPIMQFEISRVNNNVIYAYQRTSFYGAVLWLSQDGGVTWTERAFPAEVSSMRAGVLQIHSKNPGTLWVAFAHQNNDGHKLFRTDDYGLTWTNLSDPILNGETIHALFHHAGTDSDLYVGTNRTMYFYNGTEWAQCNDGLPTTINVNRFQPFYKENKLRVATYGNGIWEMPLINQASPIAQVTVDKRTSHCSRDTFCFDDYSVLEHDPAVTWSWSFSPEPVYISDPNVRNPKVVFGEIGNYAVRLEVTNGIGSDIYEMENFITIADNICQPDIYPGFAAQCFGSGSDFVQTDALNTSSEEFTITAWIKPNGIQSDYTGIVFNDGEVTGMNFSTNNQLGFHYENQGSAAWAWDSDLYVEPDVWSYVAMVIRPNGVTLYLNGEPSERPLNLDPTTLTTLKFGSYRAWAGRNYNGLIDEVCIWNRALTTKEIRKERHITKTNETEGLIAYYQFNEVEGPVLDRIGLSHANLTGASNRTVVHLPVGGGRASTGEGVSTGGFLFSEGFDFGLLVNSLLFDNMWTGTSLNIAPGIHTVPDAFPVEKYWIANIYGQLVIDQLLFFTDQPVESYYEDDPSEIKLYSRLENDDTADWVEVASANSISIGSETTTIVFDITEVQGNQYMVSKPIISSVENINDDEINIYPNPTPGPISFGNISGPFTLHLYDSKGQWVLTRKYDGSKKIDVFQDLSPGTYSYLIETSFKMKRGQIVVME